mgnify:CR=1 FL=1
MKFYSFVPAILSLSLVFALGCQTATGEDESLSFEDEDVVLAVEENALPIQWVEAGFLSGQGSFSYSFKYNNYLLKLLDVPVENPADFGPTFDVEGGAEIRGYTSKEVMSQPEVQIIGEHRVSRTSQVAGDCTVQKAATEFFDENLVLELKLCPGDDEDRGEEALEALFDELSFVLQ